MAYRIPETIELIEHHGEQAKKECYEKEYGNIFEWWRGQEYQLLVSCSFFGVKRFIKLSNDLTDPKALIKPPCVISWEDTLIEAMTKYDYDSSDLSDKSRTFNQMLELAKDPELESVKTEICSFLRVLAEAIFRSIGVIQYQQCSEGSTPGIYKAINKFRAETLKNLSVSEYTLWLDKPNKTWARVGSTYFFTQFAIESLVAERNFAGQSALLSYTIGYLT